MVVRQLIVSRRLAVGTPDALDCASIGIEDRNPVVAVAIGGVDFIRLRVHRKRGGLAELAQVCAACQWAAFADLFDEFSVGRELQYHAVAIAASSQPNEAPAVDENTVLHRRPVEALILARAAPRS